MTEARTVLVTDSANDVRQLVRLALAQRGIDVVEAATGDAALARAPDADLVLLDLLLPGRDGVSLCRALKADPTTAQLPVMVLSGIGDQGSRARALAAGADAYLTKPFGVRRLADSVEALLAAPGSGESRVESRPSEPTEPPPQPDQHR
jgi:DNA-binding response OmpR family regulator